MEGGNFADASWDDWALWALGGDTNIYRYAESKWSTHSCCGKKLTIHETGFPLLIGVDDRLWRWDGSAY